MGCLGVPEGDTANVQGFPGMWDRTCPRVPGVETGHDQGYSRVTQDISRGTRQWGQGRDRLGEAHSRGGCAWLPGTVGHGHFRRDLEQKPAKVRGSCLPTRWEPQAGPQGARGREVLGLEAPRSFVARSSPGGRAPQPPPRAGPDFPALFTSEKTFPGPGMRRRSNQAPAPTPPSC